MNASFRTNTFYNIDNFSLFYYFMVYVINVLGSSSIWIQNIEYLFWFFQVRLPEENNNIFFSKFDMSKSMSYQGQKRMGKQFLGLLEVFPLFREYTVSVRLLVRAKNVVVPHKSVYLLLFVQNLYILCAA